MLITRVCQLKLAPVLNATVPTLKTTLMLRTTNLTKAPLLRNQPTRYFTQQAKTRLSHAARRKLAPTAETAEAAGETAFNIGKGAVAGASALGIGALCYYGLGLSSQAGAIENSLLWPQYVRDRIKDTYFYFGGSVLVSVAGAAAVFKTPALLNFFARGGFVPLIVSIGALIGANIITQSIPYSPGFGAKQLAWMAHSALVGAVIAPLAFLGTPVLLRAAWYTAGIVGGLSAVAYCAPSEKFLTMGGPLSMGLGVVFVSSLGTHFLPPTSALGAGLYSIALYGGLILFSGFLLYDTQHIIKAAETHSPYAERPYDPINRSISIYMDAVNIFIRMAMILSGGGSKKK